jgi:hypothetical protein
LAHLELVGAEAMEVQAEMEQTEVTLMAALSERLADRFR